MGRRACRWKACVQVPHTTGESSPGYLPSGGHLQGALRLVKWSRLSRRARASMIDHNAGAVRNNRSMVLLSLL